MFALAAVQKISALRKGTEDNMSNHQNLSRARRKGSRGQESCSIDIAGPLWSQFEDFAGLCSIIISPAGPGVTPTWAQGGWSQVRAEVVDQMKP